MKETITKKKANYQRPTVFMQNPYQKNLKYYLGTQNA